VLPKLRTVQDPTDLTRQTAVGEPAIISFLFLAASVGCSGWLANLVRRRGERARTREWIEYLHEDLLSNFRA
jgi:hypothetical protein